MSDDVYFFDCDKTLYAYDFRQRLPRLAELTGASQYHLATTWWEGGHEAAAERNAHIPAASRPRARPARRHNTLELMDALRAFAAR